MGALISSIHSIQFLGAYSLPGAENRYMEDPVYIPSLVVVSSLRRLHFTLCMAPTTGLF